MAKVFSFLTAAFKTIDVIGSHPTLELDIGVLGCSDDSVLGSLADMNRPLLVNTYCG
jgi:hypothetical protein